MAARPLGYSSERLRQLFNALNDGIIVMDKDRIIVFINPSATRMTGWELGDSIPYCRYCQERDVGPDEERCFLAGQKEVSYFESELPTKRGSFVPVGMSRTFLQPSGEEASRDMVIVIRDVTRERQEKELEMRARLNRMTLEVQEQERRSISQELHDGVSQSLYAIDLGMEHLKRQAPRCLHRAIDDLRAQVVRCSQEVRALSHSLYPSLLFDLGLSAAIRLLAEEMSTSGCRIDVSTNKDWPGGDLGGAAIHVYRIVQEAVHMPRGLDGITTARHIRQLAPEVRVIMLTMFDDRPHVEKMLAAHVAGVVFKHDDSAEIVEAIRRGRPESPYVSRRWQARDEANRAEEVSQGQPVRLSPREAEVLVLLARGYTNREIADALHISVKTVETHRQHIARRVGATSRATLIRYAYESGLVDPPVPGGADERVW